MLHRAVGKLVSEFVATGAVSRGLAAIAGVTSTGVPKQAPACIGGARTKLSRDILIFPLDRCVISVIAAEEQHNVERHYSGTSTSHSERLRHTRID